jgi:hypothetical protein
MPQQSVERRAGLRHWPVISGDPEMGSARETDHRVRRFRTGACRRSAPLTFGERKTDTGTRPQPTGPAELDQK